MQVTIDQIKKLRAKTKAGIADCRRALEESAGDLKKAEELLKSWGMDKAAKKADRAVGSGLIETYMHAGGREELLKQEYIRDSAKTIDELVKETIAKVGENIVIKRFMRFELGG
ncbi:MAG: Elongation factor Ts [Candidatus Curtissbacteria bacterium GW2011_GWA2_40_31]|nr:MAG: Elongation factor Ts [Candidatus Curtissbacteria bacterium GW2011_GWA2_40_31]